MTRRDWTYWTQINPSLPLKMAIVGSRSWPDACNQQVYDFVKSLSADTVIVSGGAKGVDTLARLAAEQCGLRCIEFLPDYQRYGRRAPFVRNQQIVDDCDELTAFWYQESGGTGSSIRMARVAGKPVRIIYAIGQAVQSGEN